MQTTITPELRKELLAMLRAEITQQEQEKKQSRTVYQRACKDYAEVFQKYDYDISCEMLNANGELIPYVDSYRMQYPVRNAIGVLVKAVYGVRSTARLPADKEAEIKAFVGSVLELMNKEDKQ